MRHRVWPRWLFLGAGLYGLAIVSTLYLGGTAGPGAALLDRYGFAGAAAATELMYLVIAADPRRYRPLMLVGVFSKASFAIPCGLLLAMGRVERIMAPVAGIDLLLGVAFLCCWYKLQSETRSQVTD